MAQGYFGLKNYNSANNSNYMNFLIEMGIYCTIETKVPDYIAAGVQPEDITGADLNYICGVYDRYELMSYLGVKYFISDKDGTTLPDNWVKKEEYEGLTLYENLAYMPWLSLTRLLSAMKILPCSRTKKRISYCRMPLLWKRIYWKNTGSNRRIFHNIRINKRSTGRRVNRRRSVC